MAGAVSAREAKLEDVGAPERGDFKERVRRGGRDRSRLLLPVTGRLTERRMACAAGVVMGSVRRRQKRSMAGGPGDKTEQIEGDQQPDADLTPFYPHTFAGIPEVIAWGGARASTRIHT